MPREPLDTRRRAIWGPPPLLGSPVRLAGGRGCRRARSGAARPGNRPYLDGAGLDHARGQRDLSLQRSEHARVSRSVNRLREAEAARLATPTTRLCKALPRTAAPSTFWPGNAAEERMPVNSFRPWRFGACVGACVSRSSLYSHFRATRLPAPGTARRHTQPPSHALARPRSALPGGGRKGSRAEAAQKRGSHALVLRRRAHARFPHPARRKHSARTLADDTRAALMVTAAI